MMKDAMRIAVVCAVAMCASAAMANMPVPVEKMRPREQPPQHKLAPRPQTPQPKAAPAPKPEAKAAPKPAPAPKPEAKAAPKPAPAEEPKKANPRNHVKTTVIDLRTPPPPPAPELQHRGRRHHHVRTPFDNIPPAERRAVEALRRAADDGHLGHVREFAATVGASPIPDMRIEYINALGEFGERTMGEIAGYFADPDKTVVETAMIAWQASLGEIEHEHHKFAVIEGTMMAISNPEALAMLANELTTLDDDRRIRETLRRIADGSNPAAAHAARRQLREDEPDRRRHHDNHRDRRHK